MRLFLWPIAGQCCKLDCSATVCLYSTEMGYIYHEILFNKGLLKVLFTVWQAGNMSLLNDLSEQFTYNFLPLHPPVLVPGFHLKLTEAQRLCQIYSVKTKSQQCQTV